MFHKAQSFQVVTKKGTVYGDLFRYAKEKILMKVWKERMEAEFDGYPDVSKCFQETILIWYQCVDRRRVDFMSLDLKDQNIIINPAISRCVVIDFRPTEEWQKKYWEEVTLHSTAPLAGQQEMNIYSAKSLIYLLLFQSS